MSHIEHANTNTRTAGHSLSSRFAISAIEFYRAKLSPLKGFNCASGVMGLPTCSTAGLDNFRNYPLWEAIQRQRETFRICREMRIIYRLALRNDPAEAATLISKIYGKDGNEAQRLVQMAISDDELRKKIREEVRLELAQENSNQKRPHKNNNGCCLDTFHCASMGVNPCIPSPKSGKCDIVDCEPSGCEVAGCDVGPCN